MNKIFCKWLLISLPILLPATLQADDFGTWMEAGLTKDLGKNFSLSSEVSFRSNNNLKSVERWDWSLGVGYKVCPYLKLSANYVFLYGYSPDKWKEHYKKDIETYENWDGYNVTKSYWNTRNRFNLEATGSIDIGRFTLSLRERYQYTRTNSATEIKDRYRFQNIGEKQDLVYRETFEDFQKPKTKQLLRSRLQVEYNIRHCKVTPYVSFELFNKLDDHFEIDSKRFIVGGEYKLTKKHRLSLSYVFEKENGASNLHVIDLSYKFKF